MINEMRKYFDGLETDFKLLEFLEEQAKEGCIAGVVEMAAEAMNKASKANIELPDIKNSYAKNVVSTGELEGEAYAGKIVLVDKFQHDVIINAIGVNVINKRSKKIIAKKKSKITNMKNNAEIKSVDDGVIINNKGEFSSILIDGVASQILNKGNYSRIDTMLLE